tara:strand:+ start:54 stop:1010 length:957 start_codon:yes stop_codon:yes gene_type:complete
MYEQKDLFNITKEHNKPVGRFASYNKEHCWQYDIRLKNTEEDVKSLGFTQEQINALSVKDFFIETIESGDKKKCTEVKNFIERHEWLGKMPNRPTHRFVARLKTNKAIAGAIVMATPNAFSNILGVEHKDKEKLISRGACISWSPKNLGSWLITQAIKKMVETTHYRIFTAYSDPEAKELGTIYQACNFYYLGQNFGSKKMYFDPKKPHLSWFSDREFRKQSKYRMYAAQIGIAGSEFERYIGKWTPKWNEMPTGMKELIKGQESVYRQSCMVRSVVPKHKYAYILGNNKKETKLLKKVFSQHNNNLDVFNYPKSRGV